jgi:penicillin-binding protein 1A
LITRVTNAQGKALPPPVTPVSRVVLTQAQAARETYVLQQVVLWGTGTAAGGLGTPIAGKTGTTENDTDGWFIGYTPNLTTAVWMGYAGGSTSMDGFRGIAHLAGGTIPAELWHNYMEAALTSEPQYAGQFPVVYYLGGETLTPPGPGSVSFPLGLGTTTTTTTAPKSTTVPSSTTVPASTTSTSTTAPVRTTTPARTTVPTGTTVPARTATTAP